MVRQPESHSELSAALAALENLVDRNGKEAEFQRVFRNHPFILSRALPLRHEPTQVVPLGRPGRSEADFLMFPKGQNPLGVYGVVEIKRPSTLVVVERRKGVLSLSCDAATAIDQAKTYAKELRPPPPLNSRGLVMLGNREHLFVVAGLSTAIAQRLGSALWSDQCEDLLPSNCQLIPYDTLLELFRLTVPPQLHILVPDIRPPGPPRTVTFETLEDYSALETLTFGSSAWETDNMAVFRILSRRLVAARSGVVRVAIDASTGEIIGAGAFDHHGPGFVFADRNLPSDAVYLAGFGVTPSHEHFRTEDGKSVPAALMVDMLTAIHGYDEKEMPPVWRVIAKDDLSGAQLATTFGFSPLNLDDGEWRVWYRPPGFPPDGLSAARPGA
jgi:hypothetical protein